MEQKEKVFIFYSSATNPEIPSFYSEGINYLKDLKIEINVIDIVKNPELAEKYNIIVTPTLLVQKGGQTYKYVGITNGLKKLLFQNLYGKSVLHAIGFKEGRAIGAKVKFAPTGKLEGYLQAMLHPQSIQSLKIKKIDKGNNYVRISVTSNIVEEKGKSDTPQCYELAEFLGGIFTEIFGERIYFKEVHCIAQGRKECEFITLEP